MLSLILKFLRIPLIGEINNRFLYEPPKLLTDKFGKTTRFPSVLEIYIDNKKQWPLNIGEIANNVLFKDYPTIIFNVCFSCSRPSFWQRISNYANPESHWFNVFFGFYEINVPCSKWNRPYGYNPDNTINLQDLIKLGKADWNFFSNYIYGVPKDICIEKSHPSGNETMTIISENVTIGGKNYMEIEINNLEAVSGYQSKNEKLNINDNIFTPLWQKVFGTYPSNDKFPESFFTTLITFRFYIRFEQNFDNDLQEDTFNTFIYGGSINQSFHDKEFNLKFLQAQLDGIKYSINKNAFRKNRKSSKTAKWR